jgi:hypothetical protein
VNLPSVSATVLRGATTRMANHGNTSQRDYVYAWRNGWRWAIRDIRGPRNKKVRRSFPHRLRTATRTLWSAYGCGVITERCQDCGRGYLLWHSGNDLYAKVTGHHDLPWSDGSGKSELGGGCFCLACFDRRADAKGYILVWRPEVWLKRTKKGTRKVSERMFRD